MPADIHLRLRPAWRGRTHAWALVVAIPAGTVLIIMAEGTTRRVAAAIYAVTLIGSLGASAAYHRLARTPRARDVLRRLDHAMIYLLIAGTYVPFCLIALPRSWGIPMLAVVGLAALVGVTHKVVAFTRAQWFGYALYPMLGWAAVAIVPVLARHVSMGQLTLIIAGGLAYTVGSIVLMLRRPDPWPHVFGYHEVWHGFTLVASALHFTAVASLVG